MQERERLDRDSNALTGVLPAPKEMRAWSPAESARGCLVGPGARVQVDVPDPRVERALMRWLSSFGRSGATGGAGARAAAETTIRVSEDTTQVTRPQGYRLTVRPGGIEVLGGSPAGCFYAVQTLAGLSRHDTGEVCCCEVADWPDFQTRGLLHDVSRGKVPTLETLSLLVDRLAMLKINQLQLYIEHAFVFSFDPEICDADHGLTPDEARALDEYCHERFIDLVPAIATFGHMGRILSMPRYRHLAEIESSVPWSRMDWPRRMRGLTLDCMNPEAWKLVENIWTDVLAAFSSPVVNICGDEPWHLGEGKNKGRLAGLTKGEAYLDHIRRTHDLCASRGRRTQVWSDVVRNYPQLFDRVPRDATVLHWGYDDNADYDGTDQFIEAGLDTFVCPGTSGWKRIINAMNLAERNIATFAASGKRYGASGLLNTDWGDHGHFNLLACSWHGIACGAAFGWNAGHPSGDSFDESVTRTVLGVGGPELIRALRDASAWAANCETWRLLWMPSGEIREDPTLPDREKAQEAKEFSRRALHICERIASGAGSASADLKELTVACRFAELLAERITIAHQVLGVGHDSEAERVDRPDWADRLAEVTGVYAECWRARNKSSGLPNVLDALAAVGEEIRGTEL